MKTLTPRRELAALLLPALFGALLVGCSVPPSSTAGHENGDPPADVVARFAACLNTQEGQTARIGKDGRVEVLVAGPGGDDGGSATNVAPDAPTAGNESGLTTLAQDAQGTWQSSDTAEGYADAGIGDAWRSCQAKIPEFEQPQADISGAPVERQSLGGQIEASLAFARCARQNGYADFPDPGETGMLRLPAGLTEDSFRDLVSSCLDALQGAGLAISPESAESLPFDWMAVLGEFGLGGTGGERPALPGGQG